MWWALGALGAIVLYFFAGVNTDWNQMKNDVGEMKTKLAILNNQAQGILDLRIEMKVLQRIIEERFRKRDVKADEDTCNHRVPL